jgi:DNA-binding Lrp family transcriptional regulator
MNHLVSELQDDFPLVARPFQALAEKIGSTEDEVMAWIDAMKEEGLIRRLAAVIRHQKAGYACNAMVVWQVKEEDMDRVGHIMAANSAVSHCYWRETPDCWLFNLFCMIHARDERQMREIIDQLARTAGIDDYQVLRSLKEYKKTSVRFVR